MYFTQGLEAKENETREEESRKVAQKFPFSNLHTNRARREREAAAAAASEGDDDQQISVCSVNEKKMAMKLVSQTIQDYHFKHNALYGISYILLGVISAATLTWANLPYQVLFLFQSFLKGFSFNKSQIAVQRFVSWLLLALLICEVTTQYALYITTLSKNFTAREKYIREVQGLLWNTTSFIVFGLKVILIIVECSRIQF